MASLSYYSASKLELNIQEFNSEEMDVQLPPELLFDFNYDDELNFYNNPEDCYFDPFFDPDEFILPVETTHTSSFMPEYSVFKNTPKQQKVFRDNCLSDIITPSHNSSFMPEYSNPKRQKVFQDNSLSNIITLSQNSYIVPEYSDTKRQKVFQDICLQDIIISSHNSLSTKVEIPRPQSSHNSFFMLEYFDPKKQKVFQDNCLLPDIITPSNGLFNGFVPNPPIFQDFASFSIPEIPMPVFSSGCCNNAEVAVKKGVNEKKMSAQSIAARQRRKKITEKTQELGKLIPGGHRMNTAEMLHATSKYIMFLQAQAGLLEFMGSYQENEKSFQTSDFHKLVGSSLIQEKLYSSEKCLVPKVFLEALENNHEVQNSQGLEVEEVKPLIR